MKDIYICLTNEKKNSDNYIVKEILKEAIGYSYGLNFFKKELSKKADNFADKKAKEQ